MIEVGQKLDRRTVRAIVSGVAFSFQRQRYCGKTTFNGHVTITGLSTISITAATSQPVESYRRA